MNNDSTPVTVRNLAKHIVKATIAIQAASLTKSAITTLTNIETDNKIVEIGCGVVGWIISEQCQPATDKMVDKAGDFIVAKRAERAARKKNKPKSE